MLSDPLLLPLRLTGMVLLIPTLLSGPVAAQMEQPDRPAAQVRPLPTGLSYEQLRQVLGTLEGVAGDSAQATEDQATPGPSGLLIPGLVVDETASKIGRDFYDIFYSAWDAPEGATGFTIRIQEQPSPGLGTRVVLLLDDEILFQLQLQPRYEAVEQLAQQAAAFTRQELQRRQPDEMPAAAGSGGTGEDG